MSEEGGLRFVFLKIETSVKLEHVSLWGLCPKQKNEFAGQVGRRAGWRPAAAAKGECSSECAARSLVAGRSFWFWEGMGNGSLGLRLGQILKKHVRSDLTDTLSLSLTSM
jgi:hypothetical protein